MNQSTTPKGYTPEDMQAVQALTDALMAATAAAHPKIAMTALVTAYMRHATKSDVMVGAAEHLVAVGGAVLLGVMSTQADADRQHRTQVMPATGRMH